MGHTTYILSAALLAGSSSAIAENWSPEDVDLGFERENRWKNMTYDMSSHEINHATRHNKHLVRDTLRKHTENVFTSIGLSKEEIGMIGAAIGFAIQDTRFHFDDKKILALELRDVTESDPSLYIGINFDW